jgi:hypothetical protein
MSAFMPPLGLESKSPRSPLAAGSQTGAWPILEYTAGMFLRLSALALVLAIPAFSGTFLAGCGSEVNVTAPSTIAGGEGGAGGYTFLDGGGGTTPKPPPPEDDDDLPPVNDPGCPDKPPPKHDFQCDPYNQGNGDCMPDEACYIFVEYPSEPCGQEIYGAFCAFAGPGGQGDPCNGGFDCGAGHVCVISGSGKQCIKLCKLEGISGCPVGMICEPIDVEGFGGCL